MRRPRPLGGRLRRVRRRQSRRPHRCRRAAARHRGPRAARDHDRREPAARRLRFLHEPRSRAHAERRAADGHLHPLPPAASARCAWCSPTAVACARRGPHRLVRDPRKRLLDSGLQARYFRRRSNTRDDEPSLAECQCHRATRRSAHKLARKRPVSVHSRARPVSRGPFARGHRRPRYARPKKDLTMKTRTIKNRSLAGFTLIEVMITVAIIAIMAAVALPQLLRLRHAQPARRGEDQSRRTCAPVSSSIFLDNRNYPGSCIARRHRACRRRQDLPAGNRRSSSPCTCSADAHTTYTVTRRRAPAAWPASSSRSTRPTRARRRT